MRPMLDRAKEWFLSKGISVITLGVLHRNMGKLANVTVGSNASF